MIDGRNHRSIKKREQEKREGEREKQDSSRPGFNQPVNVITDSNIPIWWSLTSRWHNASQPSSGKRKRKHTPTDQQTSSWHAHLSAVYIHIYAHSIDSTRLAQSDPVNLDSMFSTSDSLSISITRLTSAVFRISSTAPAYIIRDDGLQFSGR